MIELHRCGHGEIDIASPLMLLIREVRCDKISADTNTEQVPARKEGRTDYTSSQIRRSNGNVRKERDQRA